MPSSLRALLLVGLIMTGRAVPARADLTVFAGAQNAPTVRPATGIGLGFGLLLVGWEIEIARVSEEAEALAPSIASGTGSVYVQNPIPISGVQFYAIAGAGLYRERLARVHEQTDGHIALGGGAKVQVAGPLKLRLDYRFFRLRNALAENPQRLYAGLTLSF